VIFCRSCDIALPNGTRYCPRCQRNLHLPVFWMASAATLFLVLLGILLVGSGRLKTRLERRQFSKEYILKTAQSLVAANPAVRNPSGFSGVDQSTVEDWVGRRWRVSGWVDTRPQPGVHVRTLYFVVLVRNGNTLNLEDLQLQSMESGSGSSQRKK
jgi:hypothetical protein